LRVNALADPRVGRYLNEYFVSSFQKVATFRIVGGQKQGGNVAAYFCAPDGRVLHCVAGPVNADAMLREAKWVVETAKKAIAESKGDGGKFKTIMRTAHAERLKGEHGVNVEPVLFDNAPAQGENDALTYRDPTGQPLAPRLPPPPVDGPDVTLRSREQQANAAAGTPDAPPVLDKRGRRLALGNQGRVHHLMAAHSMVRIETVYGTVFENILGERVSTKPVQADTPFSWRSERIGKR
jgi:hypothetical protein